MVYKDLFSFDIRDIMVNTSRQARRRPGYWILSYNDTLRLCRSTLG